MAPTLKIFGVVSRFLSYFFVKKKKPLSRRIKYVVDGSMDQSVSH